MEAAINGLALGLSGSANILFEWPVAGKVLPIVLMSLSATMWLSFTLQRLWRWRMILEDFQNPPTISPYGAWQMTFLFCWSKLVAPRTGSLASVGPWLGAAAQLVIMLLFLRICHLKKVLPEPFYNPPILNISVTAISGILANDVPTVKLAFVSFFIALILTVLFLPAQMFRVFQSSKVTQNASIGMLQAPCSIVALAWEAIRRSTKTKTFIIHTQSTSAQRLTQILFSLSTLLLWLTVFAAWKRRHSILKTAINLSWAGFTFPSCSSAITALQFARRTSSPIAHIYARILATIVLLLVFLIVIGNLAHFFFIVYAPPVKLPLDPPHIVTSPDDHHHELVIVEWSPTPHKKQHLDSPLDHNVDLVYDDNLSNKNCILSSPQEDDDTEELKCDQGQGLPKSNGDIEAHPYSPALHSPETPRV